MAVGSLMIILLAIRIATYVIATIISPFIYTVYVFIQFILLVLTPFKKRSLKKIVLSEITTLRKTNKHFNYFRITFLHRVCGVVDDYKWFVFVVVILPCVPISTLWVNLTPLEISLPFFDKYELPVYKLLIAENSSNYHGIMAGVQATVFALVVPITIALYEFAFKGLPQREDLMRVILRESRFHLIIVSSFGLIIWILLFEFFNASLENINTSKLSNAVEWIWFTTNMLFIIYFMFTAINLIHRTSLGVAMRRFTVNQTYPNELMNILEHRIYSGLSTQGNQYEES